MPPASEESAAAAQELNAQAQMMDRAVANLKQLVGGQHCLPAPVSRPALKRESMDAPQRPAPAKSILAPVATAGPAGEHGHDNFFK